MAYPTRIDDEQAFYERLGKRIRRRRRWLGLTQQQLAVAIGVRFQQIQKYECAANRPGFFRVLQICGALQVGLSYFYDDVPAGEVPETPAAREAAELRERIRKAQKILGAALEEEKVSVE